MLRDGLYIVISITLYYIIYNVHRVILDEKKQRGQQPRVYARTDIYYTGRYLINNTYNIYLIEMTIKDY